MAVSVGAIILAWVLWQEDREAAASAAVSSTAIPVTASGGEPGEIV
jgi:hypothetical protein